MAKTTTRPEKAEEKIVTKVGRSLWRMKATMVEWMVGPTPGVPRAPIDWKMKVFCYTKLVAQKYISNETDLLVQVYDMIRPHILVYGKPDPIIMAEIAPMFVHYDSDTGELRTVEDMESIFL